MSAKRESKSTGDVTSILNMRIKGLKEIVIFLYNQLPYLIYIYFLQLSVKIIRLLDVKSPNF